MKKWICVLLTVIMLCIVGCGEDKIVDDSINGAPEFIANLFNTMNRLSKENKLSFTARHFIDDGSTEYIFILDYTGKDAKNIQVPLLNFSFWDRSDPSNSITINGIFQEEELKRPDYLKDIITAFIMTIDPSLSLKDAQTKTQTLMDSRPTPTSETLYSDTLEIGGYKLWFKGDSFPRDSFIEMFYAEKIR